MLTTILVVEDNDELRKYLSEKLSEHFIVIAAKNGTEAFQMLSDYLPEIVISDVMMPETDGYTLCRKIKENSLYADIFVILLTAKSSTDDELQGYKSGVDIYIKKPFDSDALINQVINITQTLQNRRTQLLGKLISPDPNDIDFDPKDQFLQQSMKVIEAHFMDAEFKIDEFAEEMNVSKTVLHRKFRSLVGQTPNQFIRTVRLRKAVNLLRNSDLNISEIAYLTGFNQSHYFIKCFREVYQSRLRKISDSKKRIMNTMMFEISNFNPFCQLIRPKKLLFSKLRVFEFRFVYYRFFLFEGVCICISGHRIVVLLFDWGLNNVLF